MSAHVWRENDRIRDASGTGYGDMVTDDEIRRHIAHDQGRPFIEFAQAVLALRESERAEPRSSTAEDRVRIAARVLARHLSVPCHDGRCVCGQRWNLKHQAAALDEAGLLCALAEDPS
jgi:hypothetical protein